MPRATHWRRIAAPSDRVTVTQLVIRVPLPQLAIRVPLAQLVIPAHHVPHQHGVGHRSRHGRRGQHR